MKRNVALIIGGSAVTCTAAMCARDRHGPPGAPSKIDRWIDPPWHLVAGVTVAVRTLDIAVNALFILPGRKLTLTTETGESLTSLLARCKTGRLDDELPRGLLCVSNHNTFLDGPLLAPRIFRASLRTAVRWGVK